MNTPHLIWSSTKICDVLLVIVLALGIAACTNGVQYKPGSVTTTTSAKKFQIFVSLKVPYSVSMAKATRGLSGDNNVVSVSILIYDALGNAIGSGSLTNQTTYWGGTITVSETGSDVFCASALNSAGLPIYVGKTTQTLTGVNDSITLTVGPVSFQGGLIQGQGLSLSPMVSLFAGSPTGASGLTNGNGISALLNGPARMTTDGTNLYVVDGKNNEIRKIVIATGAVTLLAGSPTGLSGLTNGPGASALFNSPAGITTDGVNLFVSDYNNNEIRQIIIATGEVSLLAGSTTGGYGSANGTRTAATFWGPNGITTDGTNLYIGDSYNNQIRKIVIATGVVSLFAGNSACASGYGNGSGNLAYFKGPIIGITTDGTNLYVAEGGIEDIREIAIATGLVSGFVGPSSSTGATGFTNGTWTTARFNNPNGITTDGTNLYVTDCNNNEIRKIVIATGAVTLLSGSPTGVAGLTNGTGASALFNSPDGITTDGMNLYVSDSSNNEIRKIQ